MVTCVQKTSVSNHFEKDHPIATKILPLLKSSLEVWPLFMQMKGCSIERRQKWFYIPRPCKWFKKMMECSIINSSMEPATVKQIVPLIGRAGRPTQIMFYISKERLKEIFYSAKEKYALKANFFKTPMESRWLGYPAHSHHDIFPPWWVFFPWW